MNGNPVLVNGNPIPVQVVVAPGAQLTAAGQGRLLLTAQTVTNGGSLTAPDGQVILAAGTKVYLQADSDPSLRGLVVEVDADNNNTAWNQLTGLLSAPRGNITMVGLAVNQDGRISATTSVSANGSIRLEAARRCGPWGLRRQLEHRLFTGRHAHHRAAEPACSSARARFERHRGARSDSIPVLGHAARRAGCHAGRLDHRSGRQSHGHRGGGSLSPPPRIPRPALRISGDANVRLRIDPGATIDLAGSSTTLPVTANLVEAQLRSTEFADDPTQRDGAFMATRCIIDARDPPSAQFANCPANFAAVPQNIAQRTENGGNAILQSQATRVSRRARA